MWQSVRCHQIFVWNYAKYKLMIARFKWQKYFPDSSNLLFFIIHLTWIVACFSWHFQLKRKHWKWCQQMKTNVSLKFYTGQTDCVLSGLTRTWDKTGSTYMCKSLQWSNDVRIFDLDVWKITNAIPSVESYLIFSPQALLFQPFLKQENSTSEFWMQVFIIL